MSILFVPRTASGLGLSLGSGLSVSAIHLAWCQWSGVQSLVFLVPQSTSLGIKHTGTADPSLIPDGAITAAHFVKTPLYVQVHGFWDGTKMNIPAGDTGGELDPHGEKNLGNPIGGNVTTDVATGSDVFYEEWMSFVSFDQFCLRICTAEDSAKGVTAALQCEHELDIMGCAWVMAIEGFYRTNNTFSECDGEAAAPPGLYVTGGVTSTFRQRYTGSWSDAQGGKGKFTVGQTITPSLPAFYPKQSNCHTYSTISNGVDFSNLMVVAAPTVLKSGQASVVTGVASTQAANPTTPTSVPPKPTALPSQDPNAASGDGNTPPSAGGAGGSASTSGGAAGTTNTPGGSATGLAVSGGVLAGALVAALAVF